MKSFSFIIILFILCSSSIASLLKTSATSTTVVKIVEGNSVSVSGITCSSSNCKGTCFNNTVCQCDSEHTSNTDTTVFCDVPRKRQQTAFLLEFFLPFGIGHLYLGRMLNFCLKMTVLVLILLFDFLFRSMIFGQKYEQAKTGVTTVLVFYGTYVFYHVVDLLLITEAFYNDRNGDPMAINQ